MFSPFTQIKGHQRADSPTHSLKPANHLVEHTQISLGDNPIDRLPYEPLIPYNIHVSVT